MSDTQTVPPKPPKRIGVAADHGGFASKEYLAGMLREAAYELVDFGDSQLNPNDDYPDDVVPLARAVARGEMDRGVAIYGSGVGACIAANKRLSGNNCAALWGRLLTCGGPRVGAPSIRSILHTDYISTRAKLAELGLESAGSGEGPL